MNVKTDLRDNNYNALTNLETDTRAESQEPGTTNTIVQPLLNQHPVVLFLWAAAFAALSASNTFSSEVRDVCFGQNLEVISWILFGMFAFFALLVFTLFGFRCCGLPLIAHVGSDRLFESFTLFTSVGSGLPNQGAVVLISIIFIFELITIFHTAIAELRPLLVLNVVVTPELRTALPNVRVA